MKRKLESELIDWKHRKDHLPILLRGARQVGKSYLIDSFGEQHFDDVAVVDFENHPEFKSVFPFYLIGSLDPLVREATMAR